MRVCAWLREEEGNFLLVISFFEEHSHSFVCSFFFLFFLFSHGRGVFSFKREIILSVRPPKGHEESKGNIMFAAAGAAAAALSLHRILLVANLVLGFAAASVSASASPSTRYLKRQYEPATTCQSPVQRRSWYEQQQH